MCVVQERDKRTAQLGVYVELDLMHDNGADVPEGKPNYSGSFGNMKISAYKNKSQAGNDYLGLSVYAPSGEPQGPSEIPMSPAVPMGTGVDDDIPVLIAQQQKTDTMQRPTKWALSLSILLSFCFLHKTKQKPNLLQKTNYANSKAHHN